MVMTTNQSPPTKQVIWRRRTKVAGVVVLVILALYGIGEFLTRQNFAVVYDEMERLRREVIEPAEGVELVDRDGSGGYPSLNGDTFLNDDSCGFSLYCPSITRAWFVLLKNDEDSRTTLLKRLFKGYKSHYLNPALADYSDTLPEFDPESLTGYRDKLQTDVDIDSLGSWHQPPSPAPEGKEWVLVRVHIRG